MDDLATTSTRTVRIEWQPKATFYDVRGRIVETLESTFGVQRFRVGDHDLTAVLFSGTEVMVGVESMGLMCVTDLARADEQADQLAGVVEIVTTLLDATPTSGMFAFQYMLDWPSGTELSAAYRASIGALFGEDFRDAHRFTDTAVMMDGTRASGETYQVEFGVIDEEQAPLRLMRKIGRASGMHPSEPDEFMSLRFAPVATFVDSTWLVRFDDERIGDVSSMVRQQFDEAEGESAVTVMALHAKLTARADIEEGSHV